MDSTLDDKLAEGQIERWEERLSNLAREAGVSPSAPPTSIKRPSATIHELALRGFRRFSVGSIHWCRCLVVVILR